MHHRYDSEGDVIMQDASLSDLAMDELANKFSRLTLVQESPIYRVSDDILYDLFMSFVDDLDAIVFLSHVCSNWRAIIMQAPLMWKFVTYWVSGSSSRDHSATVESFLSRSQDQPITFAVSIRKAPLPGSVSSLARILHRHAHRVRSLRFTANNFPTLWSHLADLSSLRLTSLEHHEAVVRSNLRPGSFAAVSRASKLEGGATIPIFVPAAVPTWPSHLDITSLSFMYCSFKLLDIFLVIEMAPTLQHLKLYFQSRPSVVTHTHWLLMDGPDLELPELRSLDLGYNDPLSLVPFLHRVRFPSLNSLAVRDFGSCPGTDTPSAHIAKLPVPSRALIIPPHPNTQPLDCFLAALVNALPAPEVLTSL
ncbi:F-box domain-containing protein [Mycena venus]|uniref:F-box domain-containing protein n=1 Tax=Mycena venus TaxID=2733690 RepID=A0A8H6YS88_9AGAR|nr:F-box domain-containing protein [Mycena venus]